MKGRSLFALAVLSIALACEGNKQPTGPAAPSDASKVLSDGAHCLNLDIDCNPDFFFLPPLVPNPVNNSNFDRGKFNNRLQQGLSVEICELSPELNNGLPVLPTASTGCANTVKTFEAGTVRQVGLPLKESGWWTAHSPPADGSFSRGRLSWALLMWIRWRTCASFATREPAMSSRLSTTPCFRFHSV
jgi:hypothetical protein